MAATSFWPPEIVSAFFRSRFFAIAAGLALVAFDQWIKVLALNGLQTESFRFGGSSVWLDITLRLNPGAFLSLGASLDPNHKQLIFVGGVAIAVALALIWALARWKAAFATALAIYVIALGGAANLIDRVIREGHVVDYLLLNVGPLHTGVFNFADILIMGGAIALLLHDVIIRPRHK